MIKTFQADILKRALGEKGIASLYQQYVEARFRQKVLREPSQSDQKIVNLLRKDKSIRVVARELGVPVYKVYSAISRVAAYSK